MKRQLSVLGSCAALLVWFSLSVDAGQSRPRPSSTPISIQGHFTAVGGEYEMAVALQPNSVADGIIQLDTYRYPDMTPYSIFWDVYAWSTDGSSITLYALGVISDLGVCMDSVFVFSTATKTKEFLLDGEIRPIFKGGYSITYSR